MNEIAKANKITFLLTYYTELMVSNQYVKLLMKASVSLFLL